MWTLLTRDAFIYVVILCIGLNVFELHCCSVIDEHFPGPDSFGGAADEVGFNDRTHQDGTEVIKVPFCVLFFEIYRFLLYRDQSLFATLDSAILPHITDIARIYIT